MFMLSKSERRDFPGGGFGAGKSPTSIVSVKLVQLLKYFSIG